MSLPPLHLSIQDFCFLLEQQGPSLGLWRAAEIAALREQVYERPILDLGCGDGLVTAMVLSRVEVGLDPDRHVLDQAVRRHLYERVEARPAEESRLAEGSVGTVMSNSVLEHLPHLDPVLRVVGQVLRPGGQFIFTAPTEAFSRWLALPLARYAAWRNRQLGHLNLWPLESWAEHLARVGLRIETVRPYLRPGLVRAWDMLELLQQVWIARRRVFGLFWRRIPPVMMQRLAQWAAGQDLSAPAPGGGRLIVARKV